MVPIQAIFDQAHSIEIVQDPIGIVLQTSCENYQLKVRVELLEEPKGTWAWTVVAHFLNKY